MTMNKFTDVTLVNHDNTESSDVTLVNHGEDRVYWCQPSRSWQGPSLLTSLHDNNESFDVTLVNHDDTKSSDVTLVKHDNIESSDVTLVYHDNTSPPDTGPAGANLKDHSGYSSIPPGV